jgi:hypothetical protein
LCQSHNHSGAQGPKEWTEAKFDALLAEASKNMFEATFSGGHRSFPSLAFNRLIVREDGWARESWSADDQFRYINTERLPHGPVDNSVGVVRIDDKNGHPRVLIMNYACHPDVIWNNFEISADYVGYATKYAEEAFDNKINCLFINGAAGNQAPLFKDGGRKGPDDPRPANYDLIERMGKHLGIETVKLAKQLYPNPYDENSLSVKSDSLAFTGRYNTDLQFKPRFSLLVVNRRYVFSIVPGEFFIKFQLDWKKELSPYEVIPFFYGYTSLGGGRAGYVPDIRSAALGGYGADQGEGLIEVGAGERIMARQLENYYRVIGLMRPQPTSAPHSLDDGTIMKGWQNLFNGKDLSGWAVVCQPKDAGKTFWTVEDGAILCNSTGMKDHNYVWLVSNKEYKDFELQLKFQAFAASSGNSGIQFRSRYDHTTAEGGWMNGPQVDIHPPQPMSWRTGLVYDETSEERRWIFPSLPDWNMPETFKPVAHIMRYADYSDEWNDLTLICHGMNIKTVVNGIVRMDWNATGVLDNAAHKKHNVGETGHIAIQLHQGDDLKIKFKDIWIREL